MALSREGRRGMLGAEVRLMRIAAAALACALGAGLARAETDPFAGPSEPSPDPQEQTPPPAAARPFDVSAEAYAGGEDSYRWLRAQPFFSAPNRRIIEKDGRALGLYFSGEVGGERGSWIVAKDAQGNLLVVRQKEGSAGSERPPAQAFRLQNGRLVEVKLEGDLARNLGGLLVSGPGGRLTLPPGVNVTTLPGLLAAYDGALPRPGGSSASPEPTAAPTRLDLEPMKPLAEHYGVEEIQGTPGQPRPANIEYDEEGRALYWDGRRIKYTERGRWQDRAVAYRANAGTEREPSYVVFHHGPEQDATPDSSGYAKDMTHMAYFTYGPQDGDGDYEFIGYHSPQAGEHALNLWGGVTHQGGYVNAPGNVRRPRATLDLSKALLDVTVDHDYGSNAYAPRVEGERLLAYLGASQGPRYVDHRDGSRYETITFVDRAGRRPEESHVVPEGWRSRARSARREVPEPSGDQPQRRDIPTQPTPRREQGPSSPLPSSDDEAALAVLGRVFPQGRYDEKKKAWERFSYQDARFNLGRAPLSSQDVATLLSAFQGSDDETVRARAAIALGEAARAMPGERERIVSALTDLLGGETTLIMNAVSGMPSYQEAAAHSLMRLGQTERLLAWAGAADGSPATVWSAYALASYLDALSHGPGRWSARDFPGDPARARWDAALLFGEVGRIRGVLDATAGPMSVLNNMKFRLQERNALVAGARWRMESNGLAPIGGSVHVLSDGRLLAAPLDPRDKRVFVIAPNSNDWTELGAATPELSPAVAFLQEQRRQRIWEAMTRHLPNGEEYDRERVMGWVTAMMDPKDRAARQAAARSLRETGLNPAALVSDLSGVPDELLGKFTVFLMDGQASFDRAETDFLIDVIARGREGRRAALSYLVLPANRPTGAARAQLVTALTRIAADESMEAAFRTEARRALAAL